MAIYFHSSYSKVHGSRNFGDDINPMLLGKLFNKNIIESKSVCLIGIGTILNNRELDRVKGYEKKIIFSSGVGYGPLDLSMFGDSWNFACVRGPKSAKYLGIPIEKGICDAAILLSDFFPPKPPKRRGRISFIPHQNTEWNAGIELKKICNDLSIDYITPDIDPVTFIERIQTSRLILTEAMHGAIVADTMRTPWIPINFMYHNEFKWKDWFSSINLEYSVNKLSPMFWNKKTNESKETILFAKNTYKSIKIYFCKKTLNNIIKSADAYLSEDDVIEDRRERLRECVANINRRYI